MGRDMFYNWELRPIVDRQLRFPAEMEAVLPALGDIALRVNNLLEGLVFNETLFTLAALQKRLPSGLLVYTEGGEYTTLRPVPQSPLAVHFSRKRFYRQNGARRPYMDTTFQGGEGEYYSFWLPVDNDRVVVEPDTFTALDNHQVGTFMALMDRFEASLQPWR